MRQFSGIMALLAILACTGPVHASQGKPVFTNKTRFRIPYNFDAQEMKRIGAKEIRLYVSEDKGGKWHIAQTVTPDAGKFQYQAAADGEFWFCVRTIDGQGQMHPAGQISEPGLIVIVDTTPPTLEMNLRQASPGRVALEWMASDQNLDPTQLQMEFVQPGTPHWQTIGVVPKAADQTEWSVPQPGTVAVRGVITDLAGNVGRVERRLDVQSPANSNNPNIRPAVPDFSKPVANQNAPQFSNNINNTNNTNPAAGLNEANKIPTAVQVQRETIPTSNTGNFANVMQPVIPGNPPEFASQGSVPPAAGNDGAINSQRPMTSFVTTSRTPVNSPLQNFSAMGRRVRVINSRQFNIGYKLNDVGPSGVSHVEMYITTDDGATWQKYGEDMDRTSPFTVEVPQAGMYGLTLVVRSGVGLATDPPKPGDKPNMLVLVDNSAPAVELLPVEQGQGSTANNLLIRWRTREDHPSERPVFLYYALNKQGPWQPVAMALEDQGSFAWTVGPEVPSRFFVRVEVRDAAGNIGRAETPEPLAVDLSRPSAEIVEIETGINIQPQQ